MAKNPIGGPPLSTPFLTPDGKNHPRWLGFFTDIFTRIGGSSGAIAVEHGGTGGTDATEAKENLDIALKDVNSSGKVTNTHLTAANLKTLMASMGIYSGTGSPETVVTAPVGSIYRRLDGGAGTSYYVKESGAGNTGWVGK